MGASSVAKFLCADVLFDEARHLTAGSAKRNGSPVVGSGKLYLELPPIAADYRASLGTDGL